MKKSSLVLALFGMTLLINPNLIAGQFQEKPLELAMAINDTNVQVGTDKATTSFPTAGMNTTPTKMVGTDAHVVNPNAPTTKPGFGFGNVWPTAPAYSPQPAPLPAVGSTTH